MKNTVVSGPPFSELKDGPDAYAPLIQNAVREPSTGVRSAAAGQLEYRSARLDETVTHTSSMVASEPAEIAEIAPRDGDEDYWKSVIGSRLADYQVECQLGRGSMARVYRARHIGLDRPCASRSSIPAWFPDSPPCASSSGPRPGPPRTLTIPT